MKAATRRKPGKRPLATDAHPVAKANFRAGRDFELALVQDYLRKHDGIASGTEAAAALEPKEHRR